MRLLDPGFLPAGRARGAVAGAMMVAVSLAAVPSFAAAGGEAGAAQPPAPAPEKLALGDAVSRALGRNPSVAVAVAEIDRAEALIKQVRSGWFPTLSGYAAYTRLDHDRIVNGVRQLSINEVTANLTLTVPLISAPAWVNTRLAKDNRRIAEASAADVRRQVAQATARAYLTVVTQHRLIAAAETARANAKDHFDYAHTRFVGGIGRSIDEVRAQQDLAAVDVQVQQTYVGLARAREALGVLMAASAPVDSVDEVDLGAMPSLVSALQEAPSRRPDIRVLSERAATAKQASDDVWALYAPFLSLVGEPFIQRRPPCCNRGLAGRPRWSCRCRFTTVASGRASRTSGMRCSPSRGPTSTRGCGGAVGRAGQLRGDAARRPGAGLGARRRPPGARGVRPGDARLPGGRQHEHRGAGRRPPGPRRRHRHRQAEDLSRQARLDLLVSAGRFP